MPHSIAVDASSGAIWVTDVGLHQALKFDEEGKQLLAIGAALQPGTDSEHLCKPTAVSASFWNDGWLRLASTALARSGPRANIQLVFLLFRAQSSSFQHRA